MLFTQSILYNILSAYHSFFSKKQRFQLPKVGILKPGKYLCVGGNKATIVEQYLQLPLPTVPDFVDIIYDD